MTVTVTVIQARRYRAITYILGLIPVCSAGALQKLGYREEYAGDQRKWDGTLSHSGALQWTHVTHIYCCCVFSFDLSILPEFTPPCLPVLLDRFYLSEMDKLNNKKTPLEVLLESVANRTPGSVRIVATDSDWSNIDGDRLTFHHGNTFRA